MAVVFISPKKKQRRFFMAALTVFLFLLAAIAFLVLLSQPKSPPPEVVFNKPKVNLDTKVFESEQFKSLQLFAELKMQFAYTAVTSENRNTSGIIFAVSEDEAREKLEDSGMTVISIEQYIMGRENPFIPY